MRALVILSLILVPATAAAGPPFDIVFLLDESGSIDATEFALEKNFVAQSANAFVFGADDIAASLILFGTTPRVGINLTTNKSGFINVTNAAIRAGGQSDFTAALMAAQDQFVNFGRAEADDVVAVVADGPANLNVAALTPKLDELAAAGTHIFAIAAPGGDASFLQSLVRNDGQYLSTLNLQAFVSGVFATLNTIPGDYNYNGTVDAADYVVWRFKLGAPGQLVNDATPELTGVQAADYDAWSARFGNSLGGVSGSTRSPIPESSSVSLLALGFALTIAGSAYRRRAENAHSPTLAASYRRVVGFRPKIAI